VQYLLFYAEIIDKNRKNRAYADLGHITAKQKKDLTLQVTQAASSSNFHEECDSDNESEKSEEDF